ncbi:hypothetical protein F5X97DRAFT_345399 [Nemania serpens]|nr:hypothetical protein F5X97DRAFT_345399 [Nemania serpens]
MSLIYRWSLPTRGFIRDKFQDGESSGRSRCPTSQIGRPDSRRRPDLSSAFSTLFVSPENRRNIRNAEERSENGDDDLPLLAPRRENLLPESDLKYSHTHRYQGTDPIEATSPPKINRFEARLKDAEIGRTEPPPFLTPGVCGQDTHQINEKPRIRSFSLSSTETTEVGNRPEPLALQFSESSDHCKKIRSTSSSYPSEGIRSPVSGCRSPEAAIARTKDYFAEYRQYGQYPSQSLCDLFTMPRSEEPSGWNVRAHIQATPAGHDTASQCVLADPNPTPNPSPLTRSSEDLMEPPCPNVIHEVSQGQRSSLNSETTVPILSNEDSTSSQLEVSFMSYKRLSALGTSEDNTGYRVEATEAASADRLRLGEDTDVSVLAAVRRTSMSDGQGAWSTIRDTGEEPLSRRASWARLFTLTAPRRSSNALSQRIHKLRLRKWAKRVCFKTRARFELVGRPVSKTRRVSFRTRRRNWSHKKRERSISRKTERYTRKKEEKCLSVGEDVEATRECAGQRKRLANDFFGALAKGKSLPFGLLRLELDKKTFATHKRVRSCPTSMGS